MNLPNTLTLFRFLFVPLYLWAFYATESPHKVGALFVMICAGLTDILDGYLARKYHLETYVGQLLDPLADKLMILAVLFSLIQSDRVPWILAGLLVFRDAAMILGAAYFYFQGKRPVPKANRWGKTSTVCQYISIASIILAWPSLMSGYWLLTFTVILSYITTCLYVASMRIIDIRRRLL
jgi:cardiolipin synthase